MHYRDLSPPRLCLNGRRAALAALALSALLAGCGDGGGTGGSGGTAGTGGTGTAGTGGAGGAPGCIAPGADDQKAVQTAMIEAKEERLPLCTKNASGSTGRSERTVISQREW